MRRALPLPSCLRPALAVAGLVLTAVVVPLGTAAPAAAATPTATPAAAAPTTPPLVGDWTFGSGRIVESSGYWSSSSMRGSARIDNGELVVTGSGTGNGYDAATGWAFASGYSGPTIVDKTLVSYVKVTNLAIRSGSPLSLYRPAGEFFDAIDWAESQPNRWMAGSDFFRRTQSFSPGQVDTAGTDVVRQIAISYDSTGTRTITGCLNGTSLGSYNPSNTQTFVSADNPQVLFGPRLIQQNRPYGSMSARILESRIYGGAMSCSQIAALPAPGTPAIVTTPSSGATAGGVISDRASLTGGSAPSGTVEFRLFRPDDASCTGTPLATRTATVSGAAAASGDVTVTKAGTYHWTATYSGDTANQGAATTCGDATEVVPAGRSSLTLTPGSSSIAVGGSEEYAAEAFDAYGNDLGDVTGDTTFTIDGGGTCTAAVCTPSTTAGDYTVTGVDGSATATGTATLTVTAGALDHIGVSPATASVAAGGSQAYTAEGFDAYGNGLGDVTADTTFTIDGGGLCTDAVCTPSTTPGSYTVTGTDGSATDTARLTVTAAALDRIVVSPASATVDAGDSQAYAAEGFDSFGNSRGDVTADTTFTVDGGGSCNGAVCTTTTAGDHTVTASDGAVTATATLSVTRAAVVRIGVGPATATITAGGARTYAVRAFDRFGNYTDVTGDSTFAATGSVSCTGSVCGSTKVGAFTVTASYGRFSVSTTLRVVPAALFRIGVGPATATITAGGSMSYGVAAYDRYDNYRGAVTGDATLTARGAGSCDGAVCTSTKAGAFTVTATYQGLRASTQLRVVPAASDHLRVTSASTVVTPGVGKTYVVKAYDVYDNSRGDVTADATFTAGAGASCDGATCAASKPGRYPITVAYGTKQVVVTLIVTRGGPGGTTI